MISNYIDLNFQVLSLGTNTEVGSVLRKVHGQYMQTNDKEAAKTYLTGLLTCLGVPGDNKMRAALITEAYAFDGDNKDKLRLKPFVAAIFRFLTPDTYECSLDSMFKVI